MDAGNVDITGNRPGLPLDFHQPSRREVRLVLRLRRQPHDAAFGFEGKCLAECRPLAQILPRLIEPLDAPILTIGDVDEAFVVDLDGMRQAELARSGAWRAPLPDLLPVTGVFENAG